MVAGNMLYSHNSHRTLLLAAALVLATAAAANAVPITTLYNTGVSSLHVVRTNNQGETHYKLISAPPGSSTGVRTATSGNNFPIPPWVGDNALSGWVGPTGARDLTGPIGNYTYETTFDLSGLQASTASITGQWSVDNIGVNILLNGVSTGITATDFTAFYPLTIKTGFIAGLNTLDFVVRNQGGPTGLRVEMTGSATPNAVNVPEPVSLAILGSGLFAIGVLRRKRA